MTTYQPTVAETVAALKAIGDKVPGVNKAYATAPRSITAGNMPCLVFNPGAVQQVEDQEDGDGIELIITRMFIAVLFVAPSQTGAEGENWSKCVPLIDSVWDTFSAYPNLNGAGAFLFRITSDSGVRDDLVYAGLNSSATGVRFEMQVKSGKRVAFAAGE